MNFKENTEISKIDNNLRQNLLKDILLRSSTNVVSIDLMLDVLQNLLLDCKSVSSCNSNRFVNNFYEKFSACLQEMNQLRLTYDDFSMLKVIGQGAFGQVQLVRHRESSLLYALKILNKSQMIAQEGSICWMHERDIMTQLSSRWIVGLAYAFQDSKRLYMVMEYLPGGNLFNWISGLENNPLEDDVRFYAAEIVLAISVLHRHNFVHRDIKPDNILLTADGHIKLTDFGSCVQVDPNTGCVNCNRAVGTPDYISPEVLLSQSDGQSYGCEVDWWAYGVLLYEIFYGDPPFYTDNLALTYSKIMSYDKHLTFELDGEQLASDDAVDLMKNLICDKSVRLGTQPDARDLKNHIFFSPDKHAWNWDNIHEYPSPFVPNIESECDTSNFDPVEEEDIKRAQSIENCKELNSKVFYGENLQFSGFSFSKLSQMVSESLSINKATPTDSPNHVTSNSRNTQQVIADFESEKESFQNQIKVLQQTNQIIKDNIDRITIEKLDLETQLEKEQTKQSSSEVTAKTLQKTLSELMSVHSLCSKKIESIDEERHKLCAQLTSIKNNQTKESEKYINEIAKLKTEISATSNQYRISQTQLANIQHQLTKSELERTKLEAKIDKLSHEPAKLNKVYMISGNVTSPTKQSLDRSTSSVYNEIDRDNELVIKLRQELVEKQRQIESLTSDFQVISGQLCDMQREKDELVEEKQKLCQEKVKIDRHNTEQTLMLEQRIDLNTKLTKELENYRKNLEESSKNEKILNFKIAKMAKVKQDEKSNFEQELEDQRKKFNTIIHSKNLEIQQLKKISDDFKMEKDSLEKEVANEKVKCGQLVVKINEIIAGESNAANEMMISKNQQRGLLTKKDANQFALVNKKNRKLQQMYDDLQKQTSLKEKQFDDQIQDLLKEKEKLEGEIKKLNNNINYYENLVVIDQASSNKNSRNLLDSQGSFESLNDHSTINNEYTSNAKPSFHNNPQFRVPKPPLAPSNSHKIPIQNNFGSVSSNSHSGDTGNESVVLVTDARIRSDKSMTLPTPTTTMLTINLPNDYLDFNVKRKGKKMSWEKRFVKIEGDNLSFYDQKMNLGLKVPIFSISFIRPATAADAIHAKSVEIPQIFSITYDRYKIECEKALRSESRSRQSLCASNLSLNHPTQPQNQQSNNFLQQPPNDNAVFGSRANSISVDCELPISPEYTERRAVGNRKSSLGRLFPILGTKNKLNKSSSRPDINCNTEEAVLLCGHVFLPTKKNEIIEDKPRLSISNQLKQQQDTLSSSSIPRTTRPSVIVDSSYRDYNDCTMISHRHNKSDQAHLPASVVNPNLNYLCNYCRQTITGQDLLLSDRSLFKCSQSITMQLCRAVTDVEMKSWIKVLTELVKHRSDLINV